MNTKPLQKIEFRRIALSDKEAYEKLLFAEEGRGCEFSFANLYLWGRQNFAELDGQMVFFSQFDRRSVYPYPVGENTPEKKKAALDAIIDDAHARGISCRITGLSAASRALLEELYPEKFLFHCDEGSFDYVYAIDDLADLAGKKYHAKRNHLNRFREAFPNAVARPLTEELTPFVRNFVKEWYEIRLSENPNSDFRMEQTAIERALRDRETLGLEGLTIMDGERVFAVTLGSRLSSDTFDVHFEKALSDVQGAYAAVNCEFARYLREKYPDVKYLDREEDMGLEGLRKAKKSYYPHHMVEKCWAHLREEGYEY
ncbi:MAG: DUF2156 domain-containing protein [Clostridia bacterium]|nr:DUF2156 domain-containing protein [Clostridia bacterium]